MNQSNQLNQAELINLITQWQHSDPAIYKANIKDICDSKSIKPKQIQEYLNIPYNSARSYTNAAHPARIEFITALKLAELLGVNVEEFLKNN